MKQQKRCFTNRHFELPHKVRGKLPAIVTGYTENGLFISPRTSHLYLSRQPRASFLPVILCWFSFLPAVLPPLQPLPQRPPPPHHHVPIGRQALELVRHGPTGRWWPGGVRVRNRILTLIEREDDTRSWNNFFVYFSHNVMPSKGLEIHTYRLLASQEYARC
jgi:hypothetical protein